MVIVVKLVIDSNKIVRYRANDKKTASEYAISQMKNNICQSASVLCMDDYGAPIDMTTYFWENGEIRSEYSEWKDSDI